MKNKAFLLLKTMLKSTSIFNYIKYTKDPKKKRTAYGSLLAYGILFIYLVVFGYLGAAAYGKLGYANLIPSLSAEAVISISFLFGILRASGLLFEFKEYDMIVSMPFEIKTVVAVKFMYMYIKSLFIPLITSLTMMVAYGIYASPKLYVYVLWILLAFILPLIPTVLASLIGYVITKFSTRFKFKKMIQTIFLFVVISLSFSLNYVIGAITKDRTGKEIIEFVESKLSFFKGYYSPSTWFENVIIKNSIFDLLLLIVVSLVLFIGFYKLVARSYTKINSSLKVIEKSKKHKELSFKKKNIVTTIAYKEFKRMLGSVTYVTNAGFGAVFIVIASIVVLFITPEELISFFVEGVSVPYNIIIPAIPFVVYLFTGMVSTSAITPSIEGKNFWVVKTLPIDSRKLIDGKMLFNICLFLPISYFGVLAFGKCFKVSLVEIVVLLITITSMVLFSTTYGMVCGLKFLKLEFENDIEIVKQSAAVTAYLLPNLLLTTVLASGAVYFGLKIGSVSILIIISLLYFILTLVAYLLISRLAKNY